MGPPAQERCARWTGPFGGIDPPAVVHYYSRDRTAEHPVRHLARWSGLLQADAYAGFGQLYEAGRHPAPIQEAACWAHGRRKFFELADIAGQKHRRCRRLSLRRSPWTPCAA